MRYVRMVGLSTLATMALMAFLGAGSASATVLCKATTIPCEFAYPAETKMEADPVGSSIFELEDGNVRSECKSGTLTGEITAGGAMSTVSIPTPTFNWSECKGFQVTVINPGVLELHAISGTDNAIVTLREAEWTSRLVTIDCIYTFGSSGLDIGILTGGGEPTLEVEVNIPLTTGGAGCAVATRWTASYKITGPTPLYPVPA